MAIIPINPLYKKMFHANIDLKLKVVIATTRRSGLPKSKTKTIKPPVSRHMASNAESLPNYL